MSEPDHVVVAGLLQKPSRVAEIAQLRDDFFTHKEARALYLYVRRYHAKRGRRNAMDMALARSMLEDSRSEVAQDLTRLVVDYEKLQPITDPEFREGLSELVKRREQSVLRRHSANAVEAVLRGDRKEAKQELRRGLVGLEEADIEDDRPADVRGQSQVGTERNLVLHPELVVEESGAFDVGFSRITDRVTLRRRELLILAGYTADGKTQFAKTIAYNMAMRSNTRVLYVSLEMEQREMRVLFVAQHAATLDPRGVDYLAILNGTATKEDRKLYLRALDDFEIKSEDGGEGTEIISRHGTINVWSPRKRIDMTQFCDRVRAMRQEHGLDAVIGDYLGLIEPSRDLGQYRLNVKDLCDESKSLSREEGVLVIQLHQISRSGRDAAEKRNPRYYLLRDMGESSGVEQAADHAWWVYSDEDLKGECEAKVGIAKARKGRTSLSGFHVYADFSKSLIAEIEDHEK